MKRNNGLLSAETGHGKTGGGREERKRGREIGRGIKKQRGKKESERENEINRRVLIKEERYNILAL